MVIYKVFEKPVLQMLYKSKQIFNKKKLFRAFSKN